MTLADGLLFPWNAYQQLNSMVGALWVPLHAIWRAEWGKGVQPAAHRVPRPQPWESSAMRGADGEEAGGTHVVRHHCPRHPAHRVVVSGGVAPPPRLQGSGAYGVSAKPSRPGWPVAATMVGA